MYAAAQGGLDSSLGTWTYEALPHDIMLEAFFLARCRTDVRCQRDGTAWTRDAHPEAAKDMGPGQEVAHAETIIHAT